MRPFKSSSSSPSAARPQPIAERADVVEAAQQRQAARDQAAAAAAALPLPVADPPPAQQAEQAYVDALEGARAAYRVELLEQESALAAELDMLLVAAFGKSLALQQLGREAALNLPERRSVLPLTLTALLNGTAVPAALYTWRRRLRQLGRLPASDDRDLEALAASFRPPSAPAPIVASPPPLPPELRGYSVTMDGMPITR